MYNHVIGIERPAYINGVACLFLQFINTISELTSNFDSFLDTLGSLIKPYLLAARRLPIVATYLEDVFKTVTQWNDQLLYLHDYLQISKRVTYLFLLYNVTVMFASSIFIISGKYFSYAVAGLVSAFVTQVFAYGVIFDLKLSLRTCPS